METVNGVMEVNVVSAKSLKISELLGKMDPYVVLEYKKQEQRSTTCYRGSARALGKNTSKRSSRFRMRCCMCLHGKGSSPIWNEKFKFKVDYHPQVEGDTTKKEQYKLILKIMDHDNFTNDDFLGQTTIYLKDLFEQGAEAENGIAELHTQKYRVVSEDKTYHGEIQVGITFTAAKGEITQQENGGKTETKL